MADNNRMLLYAAAYETVDAALADMDAVEQLHIVPGGCDGDGADEVGRHQTSSPSSSVPPKAWRSAR